VSSGSDHASLQPSEANIADACGRKQRGRELNRHERIAIAIEKPTAERWRGGLQDELDAEKDAHTEGASFGCHRLRGQCHDEAGRRRAELSKGF
jgi:hypothetical protein